MQGRSRSTLLEGNDDDDPSGNKRLRWGTMQEIYLQ